MSNRFRIRSGDTEIEFEGSTEEVSAKFKESFEWLKTLPATQVQPPPYKGQELNPDKKKSDKQKQEKSDGRGD
jgi:hypothetical protein